jgi:hypothetical protein
MERQLCFVAVKIQQKFDFLGGGLAIVKWHPVGQIRLVRPVDIFKHTTINHQVAGLWLNWPGDGKAAPFCGRDNSTKIQDKGAQQEDVKRRCNTQLLQ